MHCPIGYRKAGIGLLLALLLVCAAFIFHYSALAKPLLSAPALVSVGSPVSTDTPAPSSTPATSSTATSTPSPTRTSTATPTTCTLQFTDVPPDNVFYPYIRCLACRGFVSGYDDGTFRPNNQVTRGQMSKIVANTAGFSAPIPADRQTYEDVPFGNSFWLYVERLTAGYIVTGYPCGSVPEEPCVLPQNRPYFRVNGLAIRGQVAKIVDRVAGFADDPGFQRYEDVPYDNTYYVGINRLSNRGLMSGYPCGSILQEPCVPPRNMPYFRPYNTATRGQISKITANTFNCQALELDI